MADIVIFETMGVYVATSNGTMFNPPVLWLSEFGQNQSWVSFDATPRILADVNGDMWLDIIGFNFTGTYVALNVNGTSFAMPTLVDSDFGMM